MCPQPFRTRPGRPSVEEEERVVFGKVGFAKSIRDIIDAYRKAQGWSFQRFMREAALEYLQRRGILPKKDED